MSTETPTTIETKPKETKKKKKPKPKEETKPTPTPTTTEIKPKEEVKETKPIKEAKKEAKTKETKPTTKPTPTRRLRIKTVGWEKFQKFTPKQHTKRSWIKEVIERARREPVEVRGLTRGQLASLIVQVNRYNQSNEPKIEIKYDAKKGIALLAPISTKKFSTTQ